MIEIKCPVPRLLIPIDGSKHSMQAIEFAGYLGASLSKNLAGISLLRVLTGRYMSQRIPYIDFRAEIMKLSDSFKKFKEEHIERNIKPELDEGEKILKDLGIKVDIGKFISEGDPAHEIVRIAEDEDFSTIIMARRGLSELMEFVLGSVTSKVVHSARRQTVYIVGRKILKDKSCPIPKILIPVDGSSYSMKGVEHAACLTADLKPYISKITLLRVINLALYEKRLREGIDSDEEAVKILDEAKSLFLYAGVPETLITTKVRVGNPSEEILAESEENDYNLVVLGRKGRTAIKDLILGGVSTTVLHRSKNQTVAIVSSE
ncbi:MAG: universal stress protein [Nitrospirae bacterium]|nr:universal stress protein [Nitrospirota bacterium]